MPGLTKEQETGFGPPRFPTVSLARAAACCCVCAASDAAGQAEHMDSKATKVRARDLGMANRIEVLQDTITAYR